MNINHFTYRVTWSAEDNEHVGLCTEFPSLSWLAATPEKALSGICRVVDEVIAEMKACVRTAWNQIEIVLADRGGFEPPIRYERIHAFQACAFNRSATCPLP